MALSDRPTRVRLAAYLKAEEGLIEDQIAHRLGISQPNVAKLLKDARTEGLYRESVIYEGDKLSHKEEELLHTLQFQSQLYDKIIRRLMVQSNMEAPRVYLYDLRAGASKDDSIASRVRSFATSAAPELCRLLMRPSVKTIGVAWGGTISVIVEELAKAKTPLRSDKVLNVIAMCGEPLDDRATTQSSSVIAEALGNALTGSRKNVKTLGITPAYLPSKSHREGAEWVWDYIVASKPYVEVFGTDRLPPRTQARITPPAHPLCDQLDAFLTSVSVEGGTLGYGKNKLYPSGLINSRELEDVVFGDLGGIPLPRPSLTESQQQVLQRVNESWTGVTVKHLQRCVAKGYAGRPTNRVPGCILVAIGAEKARTVFQAVVVERLVNHVFLDYECADAFNRLL